MQECTAEHATVKHKLTIDRHRSASTAGVLDAGRVLCRPLQHGACIEHAMYSRMRVFALQKSSWFMMTKCTAFASRTDRAVCQGTPEAVMVFSFNHSRVIIHRKSCTIHKAV